MKSETSAVSNNTPWEKWVGFGFAAMVFIWPFLFFREFLSSHSSIAINNDFYVLYYGHKAYLLEALASGHFPLWSPGEGAGFPFYSNPFNQVFYPLNVPLVFFYKIFGGYSVFDHQIFSVLGAALFGLGLYLWLGQILPSRRGALFAALVFSISFKVGDLLRLPNAIHAAAWIPWILYGIARARETRNSRESGLIIFAACLLLLTAGYPYYCYYCIFLIPPYVTLLLNSKARDAIHFTTGPSPVSNVRFLVTCILPAVTALVVCLPYFLKMFQLIERTANRSGSDYDFSTSFDFDGLDTLGSLIFPPSAQADGWYYFGFTGLFLLILFAVSILRNRRIARRDGLFLGIGLVWALVISFITYGKSSYLFDFLFSWMPGFDNLRVWSRLNIVLIPLLALGTGRAYLHFESLFSAQDGNRKKRIESIKILSGAAVVCGILQLWLYSSELYDFYWLEIFSYLNGIEWRFPVLSMVSFLLLAGMLFFVGGRGAWSLWGNAALVIVLAVSAFADLSLAGGARQWVYPNIYGPKRITPKFAKYIPAAFYIHRVRSYYTLKFPHFNVGVIQQWYFQDYLEFYQRAFDEFGNIIHPEKVAGFNELMGVDRAKLLFVSKGIDHATIEEFLVDSKKMETFPNGPKFDLLHYDGDILLFNLTNSEPGYVSFIDNWDPDWKAYVNGREVPIEKLFNTFKSIRVEPGFNEVRFSYEPF